MHAAGVVHRDLKPANVIVAPDGPRVLDFGIAHVVDGTAVTRTGLLTGTPGWLSPEYYRDGTAGPPGDVFAWGVLLAFAATGRHPFGTGNAEAVAFRVLSAESNLDGIPDDMLSLVTAWLAKDPGHRPSSAVVAQKTAELLGEQATQVLGDVHDRPTEVPDLIAEQWHPPTVEDPAWPASAICPPYRDRGRIAHRRRGRRVRRSRHRDMVRAAPGPRFSARHPLPAAGRNPFHPWRHTGFDRVTSRPFRRCRVTDPDRSAVVRADADPGGHPQPLVPRRHPGNRHHHHRPGQRLLLRDGRIHDAHGCLALHREDCHAAWSDHSIMIANGEVWHRRPRGR